MPACCCSAIHFVIDSQLSRLARSKISFIVDGMPVLSFDVFDSLCCCTLAECEKIGTDEDKLLMA